MYNENGVSGGAKRKEVKKKKKMGSDQMETKANLNKFLQRIPNTTC